MTDPVDDNKENEGSRVQTYFRISPNSLQDASDEDGDERDILRADRRGANAVFTYRDQNRCVTEYDEETDMRCFTFDGLFKDDATQERVHEVVGGQVMENVRNEYNAVVFSYGQTGSGKTYTLLGSDGGRDISGEEDALSSKHGLVPRTVVDMLAFRKEMAEKDPESDFSIEISYFEIAPSEAARAGQVRDLLQSAIRLLFVRQDIPVDALKKEVVKALGTVCDAEPKDILVLERRTGANAHVKGFEAHRECRSVVIQFHDRKPAIDLLKSKGAKLNDLSSKLRKIGVQKKFVAMSEGSDARIEKEVTRSGIDHFRVANLACEPVSSLQEAMSVIADGVQLRAVAATNFNQHSSRSHAVTAISLVKRYGPRKTRKHAVNAWFVDLAGSERAQGKDSSFINASLSSLSTAIRSMTKKSKHDTKVTWRDNKLLQLLKGAMTGTAKTILVATGYARVLGKALPHTFGTLEFAENCKKVTYKAEKADIEFDERVAEEAIDGISTKIEQQRKQIAALEASILALREEKGSSQKDLEERSKELERIKGEREALEEEKRAIENEKKAAEEASKRAVEELHAKMQEERQSVYKELQRFDVLMKFDDDDSETSEDVSGEKTDDELDQDRQDYERERKDLIAISEEVMGKVQEQLCDEELPMDRRVGETMETVGGYIKGLQQRILLLLKEKAQLSRDMESLRDENDELEHAFQEARGAADQATQQRDLLFQKLMHLR